MSRTLLLLVLIQLGTLLSSSQAHEDGRRSRRSKHKRLDSLSTLSTDDGLQRVGCFADENLNALGDYSSASVTNSPSSCATACELRGLPYAGLRAGIQCLCGTSESLVKVSDSDCAIPCPGNRSQTCGGTGRRELFKLVPKDSGGEPKLVIAHFMVGNTYPYGFQDWITDIRAASDNSIDGFALNVGRDSWNGDRVRDAYAAAQAIGPMFKLLLSFDVTAMSCGSYDDANFIRQYIANYANHPNQLKDSRGRIIVSTFGGEYCTFGQGNLNDGWRKAVKEGLPETLFIPSFFSDPSNFKDYNVVDGMFYWNGGWPLGNYDINFDRDNQQINGLRQSPNGYNKVYMAAVSPWFFTHYGPDTFNKNWIFKGDNHLYNTRWDLLIAHRNEIGIAEIISWNDYGESHYIGRIAGAQPNSQAWVNGYDHQGWLEMTNYYATAFKTGRYPPITKERIYLWSRPHSKYASAPDHVDRPNNWDWTEDYLWATLFATAPGSLTIASGPNSGQFNVPYSGVHKFKVPSGVGRMSATMYRNGIAVWNFNPDGFQYTDRPPNYNFNAFVAAGP